MKSDVKAVRKTSTGTVFGGRTRLRGIILGSTGSIGKCGDSGTQSVSEGDTLYLRAWIGSHNDGCYGRTYGQTSHMTKAQVILTEFNSSGQ